MRFATRHRESLAEKREVLVPSQAPHRSKGGNRHEYS